MQRVAFVQKISLNCPLAFNLTVPSLNITMRLPCSSPVRTVAIDEKIANEYAAHDAKTLQGAKKDRKQLNFYNQDYITVMAEQQDSELRQVSTMYHYIVWLLVILTVFSLLMHNALNPKSNTTDTIVVIIGIVFIFVVCRAIYNRYYYRF